MNSQILKFKREFDLINAKLNHKDIISVVLYGGYGRNEGAEFINSEGNILMFNDIDLVIVVKKKFDLSSIEKYKSELLNQIKINWIDITQYTVKELLNSKKSVFFYDLKYSSTIIQGDKNILKNIKEFEKKEINYNEIKILFTSRIWTFLGCFDKSGIEELKGFKAAFFKNQMAKAVFGLVDSIMIRDGIYESLYIKKHEVFKNKYSKKYNVLCSYLDFSIENKLSPNKDLLSKKEVTKIYKDISFEFIRIMSSLIKNPLIKSISNGHQLVNAFKFDTRILIHSFFHKIFNKERKYEYENFICRIYLVLSINEPQYQKFSLKYFNKFNDKKTLNYNFNEIRTGLVKLKFVE